MNFGLFHFRTNLIVPCWSPHFPASKIMLSKTAEVNDASSSHFFFFHFFYNFFHHFTLLVAPSPRCSFLLVTLSSSSLLPPRPSFFLVQNCLHYLQSVKGHFSSILTKVLPTNQPTDRPTDRPTNRRTDKASYRDRRMLNYILLLLSTI